VQSLVLNGVAWLLLHAWTSVTAYSAHKLLAEFQGGCFVTRREEERTKEEEEREGREKNLKELSYTHTIFGLDRRKLVYV